MKIAFLMQCHNITIDDYSELKKSGKMIARKFDLKVNGQL